MFMTFEYKGVDEHVQDIYFKVFKSFYITFKSIVLLI